MRHKIIYGKSEIELKQFDDNTFDSCVTDPPYGLEFMGKDWDKFNEVGRWGGNRGYESDKDAYGRIQGRCPAQYKINDDGLDYQQFTYQWTTELYRVMKPGAHILVFGGTRTYHRMASAVEDAGFEVKDMVEWIYGSGFPKSLDISKAIDKTKGKEREKFKNPLKSKQTAQNKTIALNAKKGTEYIAPIPISEEAIQWNGWGTGLKPAHEPILLARKPISERNIASNVLKYGVGGLNIDGCRIGLDGGTRSKGKGVKSEICYGNGLNKTGVEPINKGRFPANLILECSCEDDELVEGKEIRSGNFPQDRGKSAFFGTSKEHKHHIGEVVDKIIIHTNPNCVCRMLDEQSGVGKPKKERVGRKGGNKGALGEFGGSTANAIGRWPGDNGGGASRFFYQAKASQGERWFYCTICKQAYPMKERNKHIHNAPENQKYKYLEFHPTQKPEKLIEYLVRLITPPGGTVLDPFMGTGTTLIAAEREGFNSVNIDSNLEYCEIAYKRLIKEVEQVKLSGEQSKIERIGF